MVSETKIAKNQKKEEFIEISYTVAEAGNETDISFADGASNYYTSNAQKGTNCCNCDK